MQLHVKFICRTNELFLVYTKMGSQMKRFPKYRAVVVVSIDEILLYFGGRVFIFRGTLKNQLIKFYKATTFLP